MRLIVGVDPGSTVGIAAIDSNSKTRYTETFSSRSMAFSDVVAWISGKGEPVVIATDKSRPPLLARRLAAAFGARLWHPQHDLKQAEKAGAAKPYGTKNDHEMDALAAALIAKAQFLDTLEKVERGVEKAKQGAVKKMLITGQAANIETAVEMLAARKQQRIGKERRRERDAFAISLKKELADARLRNAALEKEITEARQKAEMNHRNRNETESVRQMRESMAKVLAEKNKAIKELERTIEGEYLIVVAYYDGMDDAEMKDRAVIIGKADDRAINRIERAGAAAIITDAEIATALPLVEKRKANIRAAGKFLVVERQEKQNKEGDDFVSWLEEYREKRKEQKQD